MKVIITYDSGDEYGMCGGVEITTPNRRLRFRDGEPEDNNLSRNFSDIYNIESIIKEAHNAGLKGEELLFEAREEEV